MFSKKSLHITLAFVLLIALASLGLAYGAWTDQLNINGTVETGTLNVQFATPGWYDADMGGALEQHHCNVTVSQDGKTMTMTVENAYPGYMCIVQSGGVENTGTIPVKLDAPELINNTSPWAPSFALVWEDGSTLPVGETIFFDLNFEIPFDETGHEGETFSFSYTINATQAQ